MGLLLFKRIFCLGTQFTSVYEDAKLIVFTNQILVFFIGIVMLYLILFNTVKCIPAMLILSLTALLYGCCLWLNHLGYFQTSSVLLLLNTAATIYSISALVGRESNGHVFLLFSFPLIMMLFQSQLLWKKCLYLMVPSGAFLILEITNYQFFHTVSLPDNFIQLLAISVFVITALILSMIVHFYISIFQHLKSSLKQVRSIYHLTEREIEIISIVVKGKSNQEIANCLFIEESTVKSHLKSIFKKIQVKSRTELIVKCIG